MITALVLWERAVIEVRDLTKYYGKTRAVDGLSFAVRPGVVTGFLGPNGAGKSTTMRMIIGLDRPSRGEALIGGRPYERLRRPLREVGAVLETGALHGGRSAYEHLLCLAQSNRIPRRRVDEVIGLVGLDVAARRRAGKYSLGMRQRLGLAAALLGDPPVLMCDEPVNGLDPEGILWIRTFLRRLAAEGRTVFVSSHLMSEMALTADHLIVIGRGRMIAEGSTAEIAGRTSAAQVLVRTAEATRLQRLLAEAGGIVGPEPPDGLLVTGIDSDAVGQVAARHGIALRELTPRAPSLEQAFLELTGTSTDFRAEEVA
jgi:ABC-2 type transport system ATP-binding protein